jgi:hypothetical protein
MARLAGADARNLQRNISRRGSEYSVDSDLITGAFHLCIDGILNALCVLILRLYSSQYDRTAENGDENQNSQDKQRERIILHEAND